MTVYALVSVEQESCTIPKSAHPLKEIRTDNRPQFTTMEEDLSHHISSNKIKQNKHKRVVFRKNVLLGGKK